MKLSVDIDEMAKAVAVCAGLSSESDTRLILRNIAIIAQNDRLYVMGTDLQVGMRVHVKNATITEPGSILVNAKKIKSIFTKSGKGRAEFTTDINGCKLKINNAKFSLPLDNFQDYPSFKEFGDRGSVSLPCKEFRELVTKTVFAAADTATNSYAMNGVYIELEDSVVTFVATDGRRLALVKKDVSDDDAEIIAIVPKNGLATAVKLIALGGDEVALRSEASCLFLKTEYGEIFVRLYDGKFPPYQQAISDEDGEEFSVNRKNLTSAVEMAELMTSINRYLIKINFNNTGLDISSAANDIGESNIHLDSKDFKGDIVELKFDPKMLLEALKVMKEEELYLQFGDKSSCLMIREPGGFTYIAVPVNG